MIEFLVLLLVLIVVVVGVVRYAQKSAKEDTDNYLDDLAQRHGLKDRQELEKELQKLRKNKKKI